MSLAIAYPAEEVESPISEPWVCQPWQINPYRLITWWNMEKFSAYSFLEVARYLANVRNNIDNLIEKDGATSVLSEGDSSSSATGQIIIVLEECKKVGLTVSVKAVEHLLSLREKKKVTLSELREIVSQIEKTVRWEMEDKLFMFIPSVRAEYYDQKELLGKEVNAKFPTIQYDITEAGNCYAAGRSTAVVFHLMRIMEVGVQEFGTKLGVPLANEKNWQNILDEINKAIKILPPKNYTTVEMSQVAANLYAVKLAWRNEVMHPKDTYTLEEAENLIRQVKIFMTQLAKIL